jgi:pimeloyl-ACP methyl ester carboxylesterase
MSSRAQWMPNIDFLKSFCRPVIVELFGHGRSPSPDDPKLYSPENYCREFERIRHKIGAERWFVCGQSLGASLTLRYSLMHPENIIAQIFTNSRSALSENPSKNTMEMVVKNLEKEGREALNTFPLHPSKSRRLKPEVRKNLIEDVNLINLKGFSNTLLHMLTKCSVNKIIHNNKIPALLIVGKFDKEFSSLAEFAQKTIPKIETIALEAGHAVNIDAAEQFNNTVKSFVMRFRGEIYG